MTLREQFEKLHPVPEGMYFRGSDYSFDDPVGDTFGCAVYNALWQGFQSGHAAGLEQQAKRITELEARLEIGTGPYDGIAARDETIRLLEAENARLREALEIARGVAQCAKAHVRIEWDGLIKEIDAAMGHSANTVGGPTPVMDAAPAWERKE